jgi:magnesium transporter
VPVLERIYSEVEAIEDTVLATTLGQPDIERLYTLRRDLLRLRNAAGPLVEVCNRLEHSHLMPIDKEMQPHFATLQIMYVASARRSMRYAKSSPLPSRRA